MDRNLVILSDIITWDKYAKFQEDVGRRETWDLLSERNMQMHIDNNPALTDKIV